MPEKLPYMPFYGFDYETDERVKELSDAEHGIFLRLLWHQWKEGSVSALPDRAATHIGSTDVTTVQRILATFFSASTQTDRLINPTLHVIRRRLEAEVKSKSRGGKFGRQLQLQAQPELSLDSAQTEQGTDPGQPELEPELEPEPSSKKTSTATAMVPVENGNGHFGRTYPEIVRRINSVMADVALQGDRSRSNEHDADLKVQIIFAYWAGKLGHQGTLLDDKRAGRLKARLQENDGNVHELLFAVDGAKRDKFLMGQNNQQRKYDGIQVIFRDREQVERLAELGGYAAGLEHSLAQKYAAVVRA